MQNIQFPFNQKQHIFDFKVKVNFQNGNVSLTAPQIVTPPAVFNNQLRFNRNVQQNNNREVNYNVQNKMNGNIMNAPMQIKQNIIPNAYLQPIPHNNPPQFPINHPPLHTPPAHFPRSQQIQLVNSSYTSLKEVENINQSLTNNNNSIQMIQCVLCQKSFNSSELDHHLELHRNRGYNNKSGINNVSTQKENVSNYAMTQNSVNGLNDDDTSMLSAHDQRNGTMSFQNKSYLSQNNSFNNQSLQRINSNCSSLVTSNVNLNQLQGIKRRNEHERSNSNVQNAQNAQNVQNVTNQQQFQQQPNQLSLLQNIHQNDQSFHLLGRIQNPILAIKAQQQGSLSQSNSSHPNQSLNYSNSDGQQSTIRFNNPMVSNQNDQQFHNSQINNSSFGNVPAGNNVIGPSFYQSSSHQSVSHNNQLPNNGPAFKGINRLAMNDVNGSMQQENSMIKNPIQMIQNNSSFQSNSLSYGSQHYLQQLPIHQQQQPTFFNPIQQPPSQHYPQQQPNSYSNSTNPIQSSHSSSFGSNGSLMNGNVLPLSNSNPIFQNFQAIQSRYINQPGSGSRQLYGSYQELNSLNQQQQQHSRNINRNIRNNGEVPFSESDISSISYQSRADLSQCSDWTDLKPHSEQKLQQGYNSADNSIIRNIQHQTSSSRQLQQQHNNFFISRSTNNNNNNINHHNQQQPGEQTFLKKKKQYMITSAASYYDKKFKDQASSSSGEEDNVYKLGRLSYAERLKQKKMSDNIKSMVMSQAKSVSKMKQSNRLNKSNNNNNLSKCSEDSNMSKTKLPVNYLAREEFISTSSTSKSTHKTNVPN